MRFPRFRLSYLLLLLGLLTSKVARAQASRWQNTHPLKVPGDISATMTINGSVYIAGVLTYWAKGSHNPESGRVSTGHNAFVGKWSPTTHRLVWLVKMGNPIHDDFINRDFATALVVRGNAVYVLGGFGEQSAGFGKPIKSTNGYGNNLFVTRLTDHGTHATADWTQPLSFPQSDTQACHLACDGATLYVAGTTETQPTTWDPATGNMTPHITRAFVAKLTDTGTQGVLGWRRTWVVSRDYYKVVALAAQRGQVYLATNTWQPTPHRTEPASIRELGALPRHADYRLHLTRLSDRGTRYHLDWTHTEAGQGTNLAIAGNALYVVGREDADQSFGQANSPADPRDVPGDLFVAKLVVADNIVRPAWVQRLRGTGHDERALFRYVAVRDRHVYVAGTFGTPSLALGTTILTNAKSERVSFIGGDLMVAQLTDTGRAGRFDWAQRLGGEEYDDLRAFSLAGSRLYVSGFFQGFQGAPVLLGKQKYLLPYDDDEGVLLQSWLPVSK